MTDHDMNILARTLYGEARGEYAQCGPAAFIAVANVIVNRFKKSGKYGRTIADICLKPRQFSCWNQTDPNRPLLYQNEIEEESLFKVCQKVAQKVVKEVWPDLTRGSDHYHARSCKPSWAREEKIKLHLGAHIFYKLD